MKRRSFLGGVLAAIGELATGASTARAKLVYRIIDCRNPAQTPLGLWRCFDASTEEEVHRVFYYDPNTDRVGRYLLHPETGCMYVDPETDKPAQTWEYRPLRLIAKLD